MTACGLSSAARPLSAGSLPLRGFLLPAALLLAALVLLVPAAQAGPGIDRPIDETRLLQVIHDSQADAATRRDAVALLVDHGSAETVEALVGEFKAAMELSLRRALMQGFRASKNLPPAMGPIVLSLAKDLDASLLDDAGEIVGRTFDGKQLKILISLTDSRNHGNERLVAATALGFHRTQTSARALIALTDPGKEPAPMRAAAMLALTRLSGIDDHGSDRDRWVTWWAGVRDLSQAQWQEHLLANFTRRSDALSKQRSTLQDRLITALRQRYRAVVAKAERETVLISMLADPLEPVRELSLELVREVINMEPVGEALTDALVARLGDEAPSIRASATLILRDLKHAGAADLVARRLAANAERDPAVLRAYLLMMKRQPRFAAVAPSIKLLEDLRVRSEAAGAVIAAIDDKDVRVEKEQMRSVAQTLREQLKSASGNPEPMFIELLGRVADAEDWLQVRGWLDHESESVREAAAKTWAASDQSLAPLAERAADPVIQAIVIPAATARGMTTSTLLALVEYKPKNEQMAAAWGKALIAVAGRVDPEGVLRADARLAQQKESTDLRLQVLSVAIDKLILELPVTTEGNGSEFERRIFTLQLADLLLARAEVRLASGDGKAALADLDRVTALKIDLALSQIHQQDIIAICARILGNELDEAFNRVTRYVNGVPQTDAAAVMRQRVIDALIECADRCISTKQAERAQQIVTRLRSKLLLPVPRQLETKLTEVEARIRAAIETTPVGG